jgi:glycosyltransferase involved in cell wall biosynthesis
MRIAYLIASSEFSGGAKIVFLQAEALARRGHQVTVVSPQAKPDWFRFVRSRFELASFRESRALAEADVRVATFWSTVEPAVDGARGPVFHLCQGYEGGFALYRDRREAIENAYRAPTHKLAISETLAARLTSLGFGPAESVGQAFDVENFFPGAEREIPNPPVVLVVGPYETDVKGVDVALAGLRLFRASGGAFRLRRIATVEMDPDEQSLGLTDEYHFLLPPERMPFAYRSSDIFIGPSRPKEGFGLPVLEALSCGLPTLLSDTPTHREIAGQAAWYFSDGEPESLAAALPQLATRAARETARVEGPQAAARFGTSGVSERLERAFLRALEHPRSTGPTGGGVPR